MAPLSNRDVIHVRDEYYVLASSSLADSRTLILKQGETFIILDRYGDIHPVGHGEQGLYQDGTRHLSRLEFRIGGERPILLSSSVTEENAIVVVDLTNPELQIGGEILPQDAVHVFRATSLWDGACYQRFQIRSYLSTPLRLDVSLAFASDFADVFEVRGIRRKQRGVTADPALEKNAVTTSYTGLDGVVRRCRLGFDPKPVEISPQHARFELELPPRGEATVGVTLDCTPERRRPSTYARAAAASQHSLATRMPDACSVYTSNEQFNDWLNRSAADLRMMITTTSEGPYPYAGVPWFNTPFGRDGLLTALELLWVAPSVAAGVLRYLAAHQALEENPVQDAEPGKIVHEVRGGEMPATGEVPFAHYYGTIDATPLFVVLAHAYLDRTGDTDLVDRIWPALERAVEWIGAYGDRDGDGFVEYDRRTPKGLVHQGWKDSVDSVFHEDGSDAKAPIALCEVQAYVYGALRGFADLVEERGEHARAAEIRERARVLRKRFEETFWMPDLGTYALALDGEKRPCRVRTSNAGHCLLTGLVDPERARRVARCLTSESAFSGFGIRTLDEVEPRYNPMSYHNGSVWPHDNAVVALGLARYGSKAEVLKVLTGLFDASIFFQFGRMPELFCGFPRRAGQGPTLYPVACAPQSWAAASVYALLQAALGLVVSAKTGRIVLLHPTLPPFLEAISLNELQVGDAAVSLRIRRHRDGVAIEVTERRGDVEVVSVF